MLSKYCYVSIKINEKIYLIFYRLKGKKHFLFCIGGKCITYRYEILSCFKNNSMPCNVPRALILFHVISKLQICEQDFQIRMRMHSEQ